MTNSTSDNNQIQNKPAITRKIQKKRKRVPLHKQNRIGIRKEPGYHYHLGNDEGDRIDNMREAGYDFVESEAREGKKDASDEKQFGRHACQNVGNGVKGYYMRIPQEEWEEDQQDRQLEVDRIEKAIGLDRIPERVRRGQIKIDRTIE
jgi:hypothetical protein